MPGDDLLTGVGGRMRRRGTATPPPASALETDALFPQLQDLLQEGRWREAQTVLGVLARRHSDAPELESWRELLEMRLSAEATWGDTRRHRLALAVGRSRQEFGRAVRRPAVLGLLIANVVVYLLLAVVMLLQAWGYLPEGGIL